MKRFCVKILAYLLGAYLICSIIDHKLTIAIRHSQVREYQIWEDVFNSKITANMVVLGSSRAYAHYNPEIFDNILKTDFYNLGLNGKLVDLDVFRYHQYKKYNNHQPQYILWDIMPFSFDFSERYGDEQFMAYIWNKDIWKEIHNSRHGITWFDRLVPLLRYWRTNMIHSYPNAVMQVYKGYRKEFTPFDSKELNLISDNSLQCNYNSTVIGLFEKTIEEIKNDGSTVVLVFSPLYKDGQKKYCQLDVFIDTVAQIASRHNCLFLNYLPSTINEDSSLFKNATHLNSIGADVFSSLLTYDLDSIFNITTSFK